MIPNWSFESPVALASPGLPLLLRTHLNPSTCALTMQSCRYRKTTKEAFLFLVQPTTWNAIVKSSWNRPPSRTSNTPDVKHKKISGKQEKDWTGTRSSPWYNNNCIISMQGFVWVIFLKKATKAFCYPAVLTVDGWCGWMVSPRYCSLILVYVCVIYVSIWSCSFAGGYLQQLFRLLQGQTKSIC